MWSLPKICLLTGQQGGGTCFQHKVISYCCQKWIDMILLLKIKWYEIVAKNKVIWYCCQNMPLLSLGQHFFLSLPSGLLKVQLQARIKLHSFTNLTMLSFEFCDFGMWPLPHVPLPTVWTGPLGVGNTDLMVSSGENGVRKWSIILEVTPCEAAHARKQHLKMFSPLCMLTLIPGYFLRLFNDSFHLHSPLEYLN